MYICVRYLFIYLVFNFVQENVSLSLHLVKTPRQKDVWGSAGRAPIIHRWAVSSD
jgi:hypothetical protein